MRFKTFVHVTAVTWSCAFLGGFLSGKSVLGETFNTLPNESATTCMAKNMYHEAKSQSLAGQLAVGLVVLNRVKSKNWPNDVCKVIYQGPIRESWKTKKDPSLSEEDRIYYPIRHRCQFSWYCDGVKDRVGNKERWEELKNIVEDFMKSDLYDFTEGSTHYHAFYVSPEWAEEKVLTTVIGDHIFYR